MQRLNINSGAPWEDIVGYSRAVRIGPYVEIAGTTAVEGDKIVGRDDAYLQCKHILEKIRGVLKQAGSSLEDVVRTRIYVVNIEDWEKIGRAHGEFFRTIKPAATMVEVSRLIHPDLLLEIEVTAVINE